MAQHVRSHEAQSDEAEAFLRSDFERAHAEARRYVERGVGVVVVEVRAAVPGVHGRVLCGYDVEVRSR